VTTHYFGGMDADLVFRTCPKGGVFFAYPTIGQFEWMIMLGTPMVRNFLEKKEDAFLRHLDEYVAAHPEMQK
jgi:hypothetical protein